MALDDVLEAGIAPAIAVVAAGRAASVVAPIARRTPAVAAPAPVVALVEGP